MTIRQTIYRQVKDVAGQQGKRLPPLTDELRLLESGLDSLCIAILIANLDDELHLDPFSHDDTEIPVTIGDLVRVYQHAAENASA